MKGNWFNFISGLMVIIGIAIGVVVASDHSISYLIGAICVLLIIICGLLFSIFLQLADFKNKK